MGIEDQKSLAIGRLYRKYASGEIDQETLNFRIKCLENMFLQEMRAFAIPVENLNEIFSQLQIREY